MREKLLYEADVSNCILKIYITLAVIHWLEAVAIMSWIIGLAPPIQSSTGEIPGFIFGLFLIPGFFTWRACDVYNTKLSITHKRIIIRSNTKSIEILLDKIESTDVKISLPGAIFKYGTIVIIGTGGTNISIPYITNPIETRARLMQIVDWAQEQKIKLQPAGE